LSIVGTPRHRGDGVRGARDGARGARRERGGRAGDGRLSPVAVALLIAASLFGCNRRTQVVHTAPPPEEPSFTSIESPSLQFLPRQQEAGIWKLEEDPIVVPGNRLASYLGADVATHYTRYGILDTTVGKYVGTDNASFATVEIYRFPDFVKAFGAYSMHKDGPLRVLNIENESFAKTRSINIWRGAFYVRIFGAAPGDGLLRLAGFVADRMPPAPGRPAVFGFLPDKARVPDSERFSADAVLGQPYLANSFVATYNVDGDMIEGLVLPAADKETAARILAAYRDLYVRNGKLLDPVPNLGEDNFTGEDRYLGRVIAFRIDRFVVVFNGYKDRQHLIDLAAAADQRILGTIRKQLVSEDKTAQPSRQDDTRPAWMRR
jgi:hypothetical protein